VPIRWKMLICKSYCSDFVDTDVACVGVCDVLCRPDRISFSTASTNLCAVWVTVIVE
jgi:hypothetical protein